MYNFTNYAPMPKITKEETARRKELKRIFKSGSQPSKFPQFIDRRGDELVHLDENNHFQITSDTPLRRLP
jgi:hypothetical protein